MDAEQEWISKYRAALEQDQPCHRKNTFSWAKELLRDCVTRVFSPPSGPRLASIQETVPDSAVSRLPQKRARSSANRENTIGKRALIKARESSVVKPEYRRAS
jgi:hypothetical protein